MCKSRWKLVRACWNTRYRVKDPLETPPTVTNHWSSLISSKKRLGSLESCVEKGTASCLREDVGGRDCRITYQLLRTSKADWKWEERKTARTSEMMGRSPLDFCIEDPLPRLLLSCVCAVAAYLRHSLKATIGDEREMVESAAILCCEGKRSWKWRVKGDGEFGSGEGGRRKKMAWICLGSFIRPCS